jgi:hypothetical protein
VRETFESYLFDYNTRPTGVTGFSPLEIMMNCTICAKFAVLDRKSKHTDETIRDRVRDQIAKEKEKKIMLMMLAMPNQMNSSIPTR